jgi:hypothetical protein
VPAVFLFGMMRVHMTFVTTVGLPLASVTPINQSKFLARQLQEIKTAGSDAYQFINLVKNRNKPCESREEQAVKT